MSQVLFLASSLSATARIFVASTADLQQSTESHAAVPRTVPRSTALARLQQPLVRDVVWVEHWPAFPAIVAAGCVSQPETDTLVPLAVPAAAARLCSSPAEAALAAAAPPPPSPAPPYPYPPGRHHTRCQIEARRSCARSSIVKGFIRLWRVRPACLTSCIWEAVRGRRLLSLSPALATSTLAGAVLVTLPGSRRLLGVTAATLAVGVLAELRLLPGACIALDGQARLWKGRFDAFFVVVFIFIVAF